MQKIFLFLPVILLCFSGLSFGQNICDTVSAEIRVKYQSHTLKQFQKLKKKKNLDKYVAYDVADYLRFKNDAASKEWYLLFIQLLNKQLSKEMCIKGDHFLFKLAKSYYYTGDFEKTNIYLTKSLSFEGNDKPCIEYYCGLIKGQLCSERSP
jgi:hypothetical protein